MLVSGKISQARTGKFPSASNWLLSGDLEYLHRQGRSPHTLKAYQRAWQHLTEWYEGSYGEPCDPARLIARDIRDWKSYQQSVEKAAPSTINQ